MNGERQGEAGLLPVPDEYTPVSRQTRVLATPLSPYAPPSPDQTPDKSVGPPAASEASTALYDGEREIQDATGPEHNGTSDSSDHRDDYNDDGATDDLTDEERAALVIGSQLADLSVKVIKYDAARKQEKAAAFKAAARTIGTQLTQLHNRSLIVAAEKREIADSESRKSDIESHLSEIISAVDQELLFARVLDTKDTMFGVTRFIGTVTVSNTLGRDKNREYHPSELTNLKVYSGTDSEPITLVDIVVDNSSGTDAGVEFLRTIMTNHVIPASLRSDIQSMLPSVSRRDRNRGIDEYSDLSNDEAWGLLKRAYVRHAREQSILSHLFVFPSVSEVDDGSSMTDSGFGIDEVAGDAIVHDVIGLEHDMYKDLTDGAVVFGWENGRDFRYAPEGLLNIGYMTTSLFKHGSEKDALDMLIEKAGDDIASIGQNSFIGLINANIDPEQMGNEEDTPFSGAYLVLCYEPFMPAYDTDISSLLRDCYMDDGRKIRVVQDGSENESTDTVLWPIRIWRLSNAAYANIRTELSRQMKDPDSPFTGFQNPREILAKGFILQEMMYRNRAATVHQIELNRRAVDNTFTLAKKLAGEGVDPDDIAVPNMPKLAPAGSAEVLDAILNGSINVLAPLLRLLSDPDDETITFFKSKGIPLTHSAGNPTESTPIEEGVHSAIDVVSTVNDKPIAET